jgi:hypothetical protein
MQHFGYCISPHPHMKRVDGLYWVGSSTKCCSWSVRTEQLVSFMLPVLCLCDISFLLNIRITVALFIEKKDLIVLQTLPDLNNSYIPELTANVVKDSCINNEVQYKSKIKHTGTRSAAAWPHFRLCLLSPSSILPPLSVYCAFFPASKVSMRLL